MKKLVSVEGHRWAIEDSFETAKNELGLDHNETRSWHGWHRHVSLVMLAFVPNIDLTALRVGFKREDVVSLAYMRSRTGLLRASSRYQKSEFRFFSGCAQRLSRVRRRERAVLT